jgi:chorismate dehydratase
VIEMARQNLAYCPGTGIACEGAVRSILLVSKVPPQDIRRMAVDRGSRTSVMLARIILQEKYGAAPIMTAATPDLDAMLSDNDAALIIGDPALHIDPEELPYLSLDLGSEWTEMTDLPMVFAVWSGHERFTGAPESRMFADALRHGLDHLPDIIAENSVSRALPAERVHRYLTHHIQFELSGRHYEGLRTYLRFAAGLEPGLLANLEVPAAL